MPCLELKVKAQPFAEPVTRLRALLEKPGAAVLRRNHIAEAGGQQDDLLRNRLRILAVLAVDLNNPPQEPEEKPAEEAEPQAEATAEPEEEKDSFDGSFAKGLEIWISDGERAARSFADLDEVPGVLAMFDSWLRLARYQPAFQRLDQRIVGLEYLFREGFTIGVHGNPAETPANPGGFFDSSSAIAETPDFRDTHFTVRLPSTALTFCHDLLRSASAWLEENSYPNILGSK
jgi:hypothetical protein